MFHISSNYWFQKNSDNMIQNVTDDLETRRLITVPFLLPNIYYFFLKACMFVKKFFEVYFSF